MSIIFGGLKSHGGVEERTGVRQLNLSLQGCGGGCDFYFLVGSELCFHVWEFQGIGGR